MNASVQSPMSTPADVYASLTELWPIQPKVRSQAQTPTIPGLTLVYEGFESSAIDEQLRQAGATIGVSASAPTRRGGEATQHHAIGMFGDRVSFKATATDTSRPTCTLSLHLFPRDPDAGGGIDVEQLFGAALAILGGAEHAAATLPLFVEHVMRQVGDEAERIDLCAEMSLAVTEALRELADAAQSR